MLDPLAKGKGCLKTGRNQLGTGTWGSGRHGEPSLILDASVLRAGVAQDTGMHRPDPASHLCFTRDKGWTILHTSAGPHYCWWEVTEHRHLESFLSCVPCCPMTCPR